MDARVGNATLQGCTFPVFLDPRLAADSNMRFVSAVLLELAEIAKKLEAIELDVAKLVDAVARHERKIGDLERAVADGGIVAP